MAIQEEHLAEAGPRLGTASLAGLKALLTAKVPNRVITAMRAKTEMLAASVKQDATRTPHETLSDREYEVMSHIASGKTVTEIAEELSL